MGAILFSQTELHQLVKFPGMLMHYLEHCEDSPSLSFSEFLADHYSHDAPCEQSCGHDALPFQEGCCCTHTYVVAVVPALDELSIASFETGKIHLSYYPSRFVTKPYAEIWQPPQL